MENSEIEAVVVFRKEVPLASAQAVLRNQNLPHREGMDSSRGRIYFYKTGPKFLVTFQSEGERDELMRRMKNESTIFEIYIPDWDIQKD